MFKEQSSTDNCFEKHSFKWQLSNEQLVKASLLAYYNNNINSQLQILDKKCIENVDQ